MITSLAEQIKALREKRGWSVGELAFTARIPLYVALYVESGTNNNQITITELEALIKTLGATLEIKLVEDKIK